MKPRIIKSDIPQPLANYTEAFSVDILIGMGAILLDRSRIGSGCLVGAGSVVKERFEVPDGTLAVGNPATNKKKLEGNAAEWVARGADDYLHLIKRYAGNYRVIS